MNTKRFNDPIRISIIQLVIFSVTLILLRIAFTGTGLYLFLVWNLILAFMPLLISSRLLSVRHSKPFSFWISFFIWLLFLPNAPYILTDFLHFKNHDSMTAWFDLLMLASCGFCGMLAGVHSLSQMDNVLQFRFGRKSARLLIVASALLSGFGIFLGRFLRYNSWDVLTDPFSMWSDLPEFFTFRAIGVTLGFGSFFYLTYLSVNAQSKSFYHESNL